MGSIKKSNACLQKSMAAHGGNFMLKTVTYGTSNIHILKCLLCLTNSLQHLKQYSKWEITAWRSHGQWNYPSTPFACKGPGMNESCIFSMNSWYQSATQCTLCFF